MKTNTVESLRDFWNALPDCADETLNISFPAFAVGDRVRYRHIGEAVGTSFVVEGMSFNCGQWVYTLDQLPGKPQHRLVGATESRMTMEDIRDLSAEIEAAKMQAGALGSAFHALGPWRDQQSAHSRRHWQDCRAKWESAQSRVERLNKEAK